MQGCESPAMPDASSRVHESRHRSRLANTLTALLLRSSFSGCSRRWFSCDGESRLGRCRLSAPRACLTQGCADEAGPLWLCPKPSTGSARAAQTALAGRLDRIGCPPDRPAEHRSVDPVFHRRPICAPDGCGHLLRPTAARPVGRISSHSSAWPPRRCRSPSAAR